jgi:ATP-dependent RNA helicase DDX41
VLYTDPLPSSWTCPRYVLDQGEAGWEKIRKEWHMDVEGDNIPPPCKRFVDMKFPKPILNVLEAKNIKRPTPIQMQGLPVALASRDMIGIAFTGSGKTLTFSLPLVIAALEEELRMPLAAGEGPIGIILAPSRELARQTFEVIQEYSAEVSKTTHYPELRTQLMIGGEPIRSQLNTLETVGLHCLVATPGRLRVSGSVGYFRDFMSNNTLCSTKWLSITQDVLKRKKMSLDICRYICLDEADRMLDVSAKTYGCVFDRLGIVFLTYFLYEQLGFDEEVGEIMNHFPHQRQTLLFSATFPKKFQDFARETLVQPIVVNVGRAGAANLDVIQEVEYVKHEAKIVYLLHCLQKTAPPVIIFCEKKGDVDDIHEYLLLKGVEAVSIHGGKDQIERNGAIDVFKAAKKVSLSLFPYLSDILY